MRLIYSHEVRLERGSDGVVTCPTGQLAYEAQTLSALRDGFDEVQIFARVFDGRKGTGGPVAGPGVTVFPVPAWAGIQGAARHAPAMLQTALRAARQADVAFCRVPGVLGSLLAKACWLEGVPFALQVAGDPALVNAGSKGANPLVPRVLAADMRWLCRHTAAANYVTREHLQSLYPPGPATREMGLTTIDLGPEAFVDSPRRWSGEGTLRLVCVAVLSHPYKGVEVLVRAMAAIGDRLDVQLTVVGGGRLQAEYEALSASLGQADRIRFAGTVSAGAGVREQLDAAEMMVMPSFTEGLPRALIEGMARGLPAVATGVGGIPELVDPSVLVPSGDPQAMADRIVEVATSGQMDELAAGNLRRARTYSREALAPKRAAWTRMLRELGR